MNLLASMSTAERREELYGATRLKDAHSLKKSLTTDHIGVVSKEREKTEPKTWQSTTKGNYKGTQPLRHSFSAPISERQRDYQDTSHFAFRGDASPINDEIYLSSMTSQDYQPRQIRPLPPVKPNDTINLPDMNPRYWRDNATATSLYATDFSNTTEVRHGVPAEAKERNEMRKRNVNDVRTTHFRYGNDSHSFRSETDMCYKKPLPAVGAKEGEGISAAEVTKKMMKQERDSAIFRDGDYNVTGTKPDTTTFRRDYDATVDKSYRSAAFIEPTRTQKGRFLVDSLLRQSVEEEILRYPGLPSIESKPEPLVTTVTALEALFAKHDDNSCGYVSKPILQRVCNSLLHPIRPLEMEEVLNTVGRSGDKIDYQSFIDQFIELHSEKQSADVNGNNIPMDDQKMKPEVTSGQSLVLPHPSRNSLGKEFQTTAHFKFGNDAVKPSTIYNKDFQHSQERMIFEREKAPPSSEVIHRLRSPSTFESTKQSDFINFKEVTPSLYHSTIITTDQASAKNKRRHAVNNVVLAGDKESEAKDRQKSLSHSSFTTHPTNGHIIPVVSAPILKYNYLHTNDILPNPTNTPGNTETSEAFARNVTRSSKSKEELIVFINGNVNRSKDGRKVHFNFGNDDPNNTTEAMEQFSTHAHEHTPAAGLRNQDVSEFMHQQVSKNTQDLLCDPMAPSTFQAQRMVKKSYYNCARNPVDPLYVNLRGRFMTIDSEKTGRLDKTIVRDVCREFQVPVSDHEVTSLLQRCESDFGDDTVDYHKFVRSLTLKQIPNDVSAAHGHSVMMEDYKPLNQRSFTNAQMLTMDHMDRKPLDPVDTHFFHMDASGENQHQSLTSQDFMKPELQT